MSSSEKYYGVYRGKVVSTADPLNKRRLKVLIPAVMGNEPTSWAWPLENSSVKTAVPNVNQGVWVMFENGDPSYPIWVGVFGKTIGAGKQGLIKPHTGSTTGLITSKFSDGTVEVDILATLASFQTRIAQLEADMPTALQNGL